MHAFSTHTRVLVRAEAQDDGRLADRVHVDVVGRM